MKKLKLLSLLFINLLFVVWPPKHTNSCGFYLYKEEYRFWTFDPMNTNEPGLQPLFYSLDYSHKGFGNESSFYWENSNSTNLNANAYTENINLWKNQCLKLEPNSKVKEADIEAILYGTNPIDYFKIREGLIKENTFLHFANQHPTIIQYLDYAKKSEYQCNEQNSWYCADCPEIKEPGKMVKGEVSYYNYQDILQVDPILSAKVIEEGKALITNCNDLFLKQRYAYQIVRTSFYNLDSTSLRDYYFKYLNGLSDNNWLKNNAFMYEVLSRSEIERNIGLTKIFEVCADKRFRCEELFKDILFEPTLAAVNSKEDKSMVYVMHALQKPMEQLDNIKQIAVLNPKNKFIPFLIIREINKLEDWILGSDYTVGSTKNEGLFNYRELSDKVIYMQKQKDIQYANQVLAFLENSMKTQILPNNSFYHLCAGYLSFLTKDLERTISYYSLVKLEELNEIGKVQFSINKLMLSLSLSEKITPQIQDQLAACLNLLKRNAAENPQYNKLQMNLINFAAKEFRERGEPAIGLMLYGKTNQPYAFHPLIGLANVYTQIYTYATPAQIDEQIAVLNKPNPTALEKFLRETNFNYTYDYAYENNQSIWDQNKLLDIKSMKLVQQDKLILAYETLKKIDTAYWSNEVNAMFKKDDPFCLNPWNGHDPMNFRKVSYNKVTFLKELIAMKLKMMNSVGEEKALLLYKIAAAYYSMSYEGKFWIMQKNFQGGYEPENENNDVDPTYYSGARSKYYYKLILQNTTDPKLLGATIYILNTAFKTNAAQLEKNRAVIRGNVSATDYYERLSSNCDLFYDFVKTYN